MPLFYRESNTIDTYKDTILYLIEHPNRYYQQNEKQMAMDHPSRFLREQKEQDKKMQSVEQNRDDIANHIVFKWEDYRGSVGIVGPDTDELKKDCMTLMKMGLKIHAIKTFRIATDLGLKESKDAVEAL